MPRLSMDADGNLVIVNEEEEIARSGQVPTTNLGVAVEATEAPSQAVIGPARVTNPPQVADASVPSPLDGGLTDADIAAYGRLQSDLVPNQDVVPVAGTSVSPGDFGHEQPTDLVSGTESVSASSSEPVLLRKNVAIDRSDAHNAKMRQRAATESAGVVGALEGVNEARGQTADVLARKADAESAVAGQIAEAAQDNAAIDAEANARANMQLQSRMETINETAQRVGMMQIDPSRLWKSKSTVGKIMSVLSAGIGGYLTAKGVPNNIQAIIDKVLDRDIEAQRQNILNAQHGLQNQRGLLSDELGIMKTQAGQRALARGLQMTHLAAEMKAQGAKFKNELIRAKYDETAAETQLRAEQFLQKASALEFDKDLKLAGLQLRREVLASRKISGRVSSGGRSAKEDARLRKLATQHREQALFDPTGVGKDGKPGRVLGFMVSKSVAERAKLRKRVTDYNAYRKSFSDYVSDIKKLGSTIDAGRLSAAEHTRLKRKRQRIAALIAHAITGAQSSNTEYKRIQDSFVTAMKSMLDRRDISKESQTIIDEGDFKFYQELGTNLTTEPGGVERTRFFGSDGKFLGKTTVNALRASEKKRTTSDTDRGIDALTKVVGKRPSQYEAVQLAAGADIDSTKQGRALHKLYKLAIGMGKGKNKGTALKAAQALQNMPNLGGGFEKIRQNLLSNILTVNPKLKGLFKLRKPRKTAKQAADELLPDSE